VITGVFQTGWPFLAGAAIAWLGLRIWRAPLRVWPAGVAVWLWGVFFGMLLRGVTGLAESLRGRDDFPADVADALGAIAAGDQTAYRAAVAAILHSFETREEYLEDIPVADTVVVLQALAGPRGLAAALDSPLLPSS